MELILLEQLELGKELGPGKTIVTILCDRSQISIVLKCLIRKFLEEKGLPYPNWI